MSQPAAALYIQPPTFEITVAVQMIEKALYLNELLTRCSAESGASVILRCVPP